LTAKSPASPTAGPIPFDSNKLERVIDERVAPLRKELGQKTDRLEHNKLANTASALEEKLDQIEGKLGLRLEARAKLVEDLMHEQSSSMTKEVDETKRKITQVSVEGDKVKDELGNALKEMARVEERLSARYAELQSALNHQAVPDSFYAKTLGAVLGQNIEDLHEANFEKLIGERLNQFFQTGVARASDVLQDLGGRADRINGALKAVSDQMTKVNPQATDEARPNLQRAEALATDMSVLQSQLQTRRTTIETMLRVPVSMHAGARQTFLDELGRGIRREIEKLNDPEGYFEGELERLITADLIAIVDICDKKVASAPGTRPELEGALKKLFDEAGLRSIVPTRGEQFKTAEQDLIEMDQGGASLTVSQVVSRGFYYKHRGSETLLRKAGVRVYR